ncbi:MAG: very short patch repair endonuclease [Acidobacteriota bacterium]
MADNRTRQSRSALMSRVGSRDTAPELTVRRLLHRLGYRFRLHRRSLPGTPDIIFPSRRKAIFVHGCYWHAHGCRIGKMPKSNTEYWSAKLARNRERDTENRNKLEELRWSVLEVWQCQTSNPCQLSELLVDFLGRTGRIPIDL